MAVINNILNMNPNQRGFTLMTLAIILVIASLAVIAGTAYIQNTSNINTATPATTDEVTNTIVEAPLVKPTEKKPVTTSVTNKTSNVVPTGKISCNLNDIDCFAKASKTCTASSLRTRNTANIFSMLITSEEYQEIKPGNGQTCLWSKIVSSYNLVFSPEYRQSLLSKMSETEVKAREEETAKQGRSQVEGKEVSCAFASGSSMTTLITQMKEAGQGSFNFKAKVDFSLSPQEQEIAQAKQYASQIGALSCSGSLFRQS